MKINKSIFKILFLYFFIFILLFLAFYLLRPFSFNLNNYIFITFLNLIIGLIVLCVSMCFIYRNAHKQSSPLQTRLISLLKKNNNGNSLKYKFCDNIYWICKNIPFIIYLANILISISIIIIFREQLSFVLSLLSIFATTIFYIFSRKVF